MSKVSSPSQYGIDPEAFGFSEALTRILSTTVSVYESYGVPLPTRQYWCAGQAAEDCEQLVVVYTGGFLGSPGEQQQTPLPCKGPMSMNIQIHVTRNVPVTPDGSAPRPDRIQDMSQWPAIDAWVLMNNLDQFDVGSLGYSGGGVIATVNVAAPSGGVQTTTLTMTMGAI